MAGKSRKSTLRITYCAAMAALSIVILYLGSLIEILDLSCGAIASLLIVLTVLEINKKCAYAIWVVTSVLSILILPDKFIAFFYAACCGIYPILKSYFEKANGPLQWVFKLIYFNVVLAATIVVSKYVLMLQDTDIAFTILVFVLGNIAFILYDFAVTKLITLYINRLRNISGIKSLFKNIK